jgi:hypothetical protein
VRFDEPSIRALLGTAPHFCEVVVLKSRTYNSQGGLSKSVVEIKRMRCEDLDLEDGLSKPMSLSLFSLLLSG